MKINLLPAAAILFAGFAQAGTIIDSTFNGAAGTLPDPAIWQVEDSALNLQNGAGGLLPYSATASFGVRALNTYGVTPGAGETVTAAFTLENTVNSGSSAPTVVGLLNSAYSYQVWVSNDSGTGFWDLNIAGQGRISTTVADWYLPPSVSIAWSSDNIVMTMNGGGSFGQQVIDVAALQPTWVIPTEALQPGAFTYAYNGVFGSRETANVFVNSVSYVSVPEPSTVLLAGLGLGAVIFGLRRHALKA